MRKNDKTSNKSVSFNYDTFDISPEVYRKMLEENLDGVRKKLNNISLDKYRIQYNDFHKLSDKKMQAKLIELKNKLEFWKSKEKKLENQIIDIPSTEQELKKKLSKIEEEKKQKIKDKTLIYYKNYYNQFQSFRDIEYKYGFIPKKMKMPQDVLDNMKQKLTKSVKDVEKYYNNYYEKEINKVIDKYNNRGSFDKELKYCREQIKNIDNQIKELYINSYYSGVNIRSPEFASDMKGYFSKSKNKISNSKSKNKNQSTKHVTFNV